MATNDSQWRVYGLIKFTKKIFFREACEFCIDKYINTIFAMLFLKGKSLKWAKSSGLLPTPGPMYWGNTMTQDQEAITASFLTHTLIADIAVRGNRERNGNNESFYLFCDDCSIFNWVYQLIKRNFLE